MNYYKELEINLDASQDDIRSAYKKLALKWHPDRNPNNKEEAEEKFKKISESYQMLSDTNKKKRYDDHGHENFNYNFQNKKDLFKNFFEDIPLEYIELANTFILEFLNSPECNLTFKIFANMPNKENIIKVLEIFKNDLPANTKDTLQKYINKLKKNEGDDKKNPESTILDIATNYAFNIFNQNMKISKKPVKNNKNKIIENHDYFENKSNDIEFNVNCSLEDIYNKVEKEIIITRINRYKEGEGEGEEKNKKPYLFDNHRYYNEEKKLHFPANFRPTLTFKNEGNLLPGNKEPGNVIININNKKNKLFKIFNDYDLITERYISIYEIYHGCIFTLEYFNQRKISIRSNPNIFKNTIQKIEKLGLPIPQTSNYGDLYIKFIVQYPTVKEKDNQILFELFPPVNTGIPDSIDIQNYEEYLLNSEDYYFNDNPEE